MRSVEDAKAEIGHHFPGLMALAREVHARFQQECRTIAPLLEARSRASIYRDIFVRHLRDYCDATQGAHYHRKNQLVLVGLESQYLVRVKRLAAGFTVSVSPTHASEQYDANALPDYARTLFPGAAEATLLYLGWSVPENAPGEIEVYLVCNDANRNLLWALPLGDADSGRGIQQPLPLPMPGEGVGVRVVVKDRERKENG